MWNYVWSWHIFKNCETMTQVICHSPQPSSEGTAVLMTFNIPKDILGGGGGAEFNNPSDNRGGGGGGGGGARFDIANNLLAPNSLHSKNVQQQKGSHGDHPEKNSKNTELFSQKNSTNMELIDQKNINSTELVDRKKRTQGDLQLCNMRRPTREPLEDDSAKRLFLDSSDIFHWRLHLRLFFSSLFKKKISLQVYD